MNGTRRARLSAAVFGLAFGVAVFSLPSWALQLREGSTQLDLDPSTLEIRFGQTLINLPQAPQEVSSLESSRTQASWQWPKSDMRISAKLSEGELALSFKTSKPQGLHWFSLPREAETLLLPIGEGSRVPLGNPDWRRYLSQEMAELDTHWDLKLPLWSQKQGRVFYSFLLLNPFDNRVTFTLEGTRLQMRGVHEFNRFNQGRAFEVLLHAGEASLSGALRYRKYLQQSGQFKPLSQKFKTLKDGRKLIGATYVYLWGNGLLAREDVKDWPGLLGYLRSKAGSGLLEAMDKEAREAVGQLAGRAPQGWQQSLLVEALNQALMKQVPLGVNPNQDSFLSAQRDQADAVRAWAALRIGRYLAPSQSWGQGLSVPLLDSLKAAGLPRLWLGTDNWTAVFLNPKAVTRAKNLGYLLASYDSYDTAIAPGVNDGWLTAQIPDELREKCAIVGEDGRKKPGFGGRGYYLNPVCMMWFSQGRMRELVSLGGLDSLFLDVDGTGMSFDDYQPEHPTGAEGMVAARNARMRWVGEGLKLPLGSEDGNAVTAGPLVFAHGMETWGFGWRDKEMRQDKRSPYYLGAWWPDFEPAAFFKPSKVKPLYRSVAFDPRHRLPLYQAVFHDAIISSHHWSYDNLKFSEVKIARDLLSQLYNTAPLFNLSRGTLKARLGEIKKADAVFRPLHEALWDKALVDFQWLDAQGLVQQTRFSDGSILVANFGDRAFRGIEAHSLRASLSDGRVLSFRE